MSTLPQQIEYPVFSSRIDADIKEAVNSYIREHKLVKKDFVQMAFSRYLNHLKQGLKEESRIITLKERKRRAS